MDTMIVGPDCRRRPSSAAQTTRFIDGLLTGHGDFRKHLRRIGVPNTVPICMLCGDEEETASHLIFECEFPEHNRFRNLDSTDDGDRIKRDMIRRVLVGRWLLNLFKGSAILPQ